MPLRRPPSARVFVRIACWLFALFGLSSLAAVHSGLVPTALAGLRYTNDFFPGISYRSDVPSLPDLLGFPAAERAATSIEIERCLKAWTNAAPDRTRLVEYARSHEGRPLHYMVVTSPANLARLDQIPDAMARLGDPRRTRDAEAESVIQAFPAVVWLAATIHGDETEGSDAMLVVLHHLLAGDDPAMAACLDDLVVIVDPLMNPDGRDRFLKMIAEHRGTSPNVDDQSLLHAGYWPWGRGNHYLFDLNRDWLFAVHPETRGRIREVARWNPVLFVDAHGMGAQDTHLFSPPREPINPNVSLARRRWGQVFARDQARAFDGRGLVYYTGEWNEEWYPGYSDSWAAYRGLVGILYEQARIAADGVRRPEGRILSYRESVLHHVVGALANLSTAQRHAKALLRDFHANRREAVDPAGRYARRTFAIPPTPNTSRFNALVDLLQLQGFELLTTSALLTPPAAVDQLGRSLTNLALPAGTLLIPNRQPLAHLLAAFLEFDPHLSEDALRDERTSLLLRRESRIYDATAWNLTQMFGLPAFEISADLSDQAARYASPPSPPALDEGDTLEPVAWILDGADDHTLGAAARLMERGVQVRVASRPLSFSGLVFERGSLVVTRLDHRAGIQDLRKTIEDTAREFHLTAHATSTGFGEGDLPDLGGGHFGLLVPPRIATLAREGASFTDYGSIWYTLDHRLGIRHSQLNTARSSDLARYNVVILPDGLDVPESLRNALKDWVHQGGTLIAIQGSTRNLIRESAGFSRVRALPDVLDRLPDFELAVLREWEGRSGNLPALTHIWSHEPSLRIAYPWQAAGPFPEEKELKKRDAWQSLFMPAGTILAGRVDTNHWLTAGCPEPLPILAGNGPVLMADGNMDAPIRFGYLTAAPGDPQVTTSEVAPPPPQDSSDRPGKGAAASAESARVGWSSIPPETRMHLRMSGLLWPEAAHRLANSAWVTREAMGRGQVILFASPPTFRGGALGATRVFLNAVVLGPGLGTQPPLHPR